MRNLTSFLGAKMRDNDKKISDYLLPSPESPHEAAHTMASTEDGPNTPLYTHIV